MSSPANPYAPPVARVDDIGAVDSQAEAIRREHIKHEASIRSVGVLYILGGVIGTLAGIVMLAAGARGEQGVLAFVLGGIYIATSALSFVAGLALRRLQLWARTASIALSCIGLLGFPIGTLINAYILYLMLSAKGKRIFERDYAEVVAATPHIKHKTSIVVWIVLGILLLGVVAAILIPTLSR